MLFERTRDWYTFDYYDLSNDKAAWRFTALDDDDEIELTRAGFRPLGVAQARLRANQNRRLTTQVWVSDDGRVLADGAELATFFEDGTIVKTNIRPQSPFFNATRWRIRSHPKDRHPYALVEGPLSARLAAHDEQIARFEKDSPVVVAGSMTEHFAMRMRDAELRIARQRPEEVITVWTSVTLGMTASVVIMLTLLMRLPKHTSFPQTAGVIACSTLAFLIVALAIGKVLFTWIAPWLVRLRPGPPRRPAAAWIEIARDVPAGTLEG